MESLKKTTACKPSLTDEFDRKFRSLRVSLTQACNFQCVYCVPQGLSLKKLPQELAPAELFFLTQQILKSCGIKKIRLTGGEPLLYQGLQDFLNATNKLSVEKSITTNGLLLEKNLQLLWQCGYKRINISLDSLRSESFQVLSRRKGMSKILNALEKASEIGFSLKINVVPMKSINEDQILPLLDFCLQRNIECRYIELMQMGHINKKVFEKYFISMQEILMQISTKYQFHKIETDVSATAQKFQIAPQSTFGIIPNYSAPFCQHCDRLRITSDGKLYGCISSRDHHCLKHLLQKSPKECQEELQKILPLAMKSKKKTFVGTEIFMQEIGG